MKSEMEFLNKTEIEKDKYGSYVKEAVKQKKMNKVLIVLIVIALLGNVILGYSYIKQLKLNRTNTDRIDYLTIGRCSNGIFNTYDAFNSLFVFKNYNKDYVEYQFTLVGFCLQDALEGIETSNLLLNHKAKKGAPKYSLKDLDDLLIAYDIEIGNLKSYIQSHNINNLKDYPYIKGIKDDFHYIYSELLDERSSTGDKYISQMTDKEFSDKFSKVLNNLQTKNVKHRFLNPNKYMHKESFTRSISFYKGVFKK